MLLAFFGTCTYIPRKSRLYLNLDFLGGWKPRKRQREHLVKPFLFRHLGESRSTEGLFVHHLPEKVRSDCVCTECRTCDRETDGPRFLDPPAGPGSVFPLGRPQSTSPRRLDGPQVGFDLISSKMFRFNSANAARLDVATREESTWRRERKEPPKPPASPSL